MNKLNIFVLSLLLVPFLTFAISLDEQNNYIKILDGYKKSDNELNELYKKQMIEYKQEWEGVYGQKESKDVYLKRAQQAWIKMRDASCDYETYESKTGTGFSSIYEKCLLDKTNERIQYLKDNN
ncbi:lysozyme inhibitor LprI family protein [Hafnia alvei]|uniref:Lysozyme inhibitor LprI-like N-terminal domain-containing protein n=1 Tax=Hafnia alvei TaxID=569 RepID=A0A1C6Z758_HAFAL|nr:lysozyme inhibitor LprI family protein [Hafnia alvei]NLS54058.1 DUF1311 domain-containing protein [Hafnia alvei]SCM55022.1 Protein of unknown function (DUF1311) [Hafnia alvei]